MGDATSVYTVSTFLGIFMCMQYDHTGQITHLNQAILHLQQALDVATSNDRNLASLLNVLGDSLMKHYEQTGDVQALDQAIGHHWHTINLPSIDDSAMPT